MTLEEFAALAGVTVFEDKQFLDGGKSFAYKEEDFPNCATTGFDSRQEALEHWLHGLVGFVNGQPSKFGQAVIKLLEQSQ